MCLHMHCRTGPFLNRDSRQAEVHGISLVADLYCFHGCVGGYEGCMIPMRIYYSAPDAVVKLPLLWLQAIFHAFGISKHPFTCNS